MQKIRFALLALSALLAGCSGPQKESEWPSLKKKIRAEFPRVSQMSVQELSEILEATKVAKPILLDVRESEEFAVSHLAGARHAPNLDAAGAILAGEAKDRLIVAYCSVGYRSSRLTKKLMEAGYRNAYNLEGSIFEWANSGHEVVRGNAPTKAVHPYDEEWGKLLEEPRRSYEPRNR